MTTIHVEFVDAATGGAFAKSDIPSEQLPETFALETTLHLGDADWQVERAEPPTRAEYTRTRSLRVTLRKIVMIDPKKILFSLPTIENALPPTFENAASATRLRDDDWRQIELVAVTHDAVIQTELAAIREVIASKRAAGFERLHVRSRIREPLAGVRLTIREVAQTMRRELGFDSPGWIVDGGFAFEDGALYGREHAGAVVVLGLAPTTDAARVAAIAATHRLVLVDWCRATVRTF